jgi:hypothetical protein
MSILHVKESGWFPFCGLSKEPENGPDTDYPVGVPLKKAMEWWWLVKYWKMNILFNLSETSNNNKYSTSYQPSKINTFNGFSYSENTNQTTQTLVCAEMRDFYSEAIGGQVRNDSGEDNGEYEQDYTLDVGFTFFSSFWIDKNKIVWPYIRVSGWLDSKQKGAEKVQQQLDPFVSFIIDGISIPVHVNWSPGWVGDSEWKATGITKIELQPVYF